MKGQSLVIQFLLFFMIGLSLFIAIGGVFRLQSDIIREDVAEANRKLIGSYISSIVISMANSCKECDYINSTLKLKNVIANYIIILNLTNNGLQIFSEPGGGNTSVSLRNLNESFSLTGNASSTTPIILRLNNTAKSLDLGLGP